MLTPLIMLGLKHVGEGTWRSREAIQSAFGAAADRLPKGYVSLVSNWGPGELCAFIELADPTLPEGRHDRLARRLRERGPAARDRGRWLELPDIADVAFLGLDRRGAALVARGPHDVLFLHPRGLVEVVGTFERLVADYLCGDGLSRSLRSDVGTITFGWHEIDLVVPAIYATQPLPSSLVIAALVRGDQSATDRAISDAQRLEVIPFTLLELLERILGPDADAVTPDLRESTLAELYILAKRCMPTLSAKVPIRDIRRALTDATVRASVLVQLRQLASLPGSPIPSIFDDEIADVPAAPMSAVVASVQVPAVVNAADRGLIAPVDFPPVDVDAVITARVATWREQDPSIDLAPLLESIARLHPTQRQGYESLIAHTHDIARQHLHRGYVRRAPEHLMREIADAWPQLVLTLRAGPHTEAQTCLDILQQGRLTAAAPYLLSLTRHPPPCVTDRWCAEEAYLAVADLPADALVDLALEILDPKARSTVRRKRLAYAWLAPFAADERVFAMYLDNFVLALPHSEAALALHPNDPRIEPTLRAHMQREELRATAGYETRDPNYSDGLEAVARLLVKRGDPDAKTLLARIRRHNRRDPL